MRKLLFKDESYNRRVMLFIFKSMICIFIGCSQYSYGQDVNQNWVKKINYKTETTSPLSSPTADQVSVNVVYMDGLGRTIQQIASKQSLSGKDIVIHTEYDEFGRQVKDYLPYKSSNSSMEFTLPQAALQNTYNQPEYAGQLPFSEKAFDGSPLNRLQMQAFPGTTSNWAMGSGHEVRYATTVNTQQDGVRKLAVTSNAIIDNGAYAEKKLYKYITTDENGRNSEVYKNSRGQTVLKRNFGTNNALIDTYYIYNDRGNLSYVLPAGTIGNSDTTTLSNLCYQYKYDQYDRLIEKKEPEKETEFIVYDKLNRVVATGPAFSPFGDGTTGWIITKYDKQNRPAYTGWYAHTFTATSRENLQANNNNGVFNVMKTASGTIDGISANYTINADWLTTCRLLTVNYYDDYTFPNAPSIYPSGSYNNSTKKPVGMATGSWVRVLGSSPTPAIGETSYIIYDYRGRPIQTYRKNHLSKVTITNTIFDFEGKIISNTKEQQLLSGTATIKAKDVYSYNNQGQALKHTHQNDNNTIQLLASNTYNELGLLITKMVGGADVSGATAYQKIDYSYNIRGWLKGINNAYQTLSTAQVGAQNDLFAYAINYNENVETDNDASTHNVPKMYDGNISEIFWRSSNDNQLRKYGYNYDSMKRMVAAVYQKPDGADPTRNAYDEIVQYNDQGNITGLQRNGNLDIMDQPLPIDNLYYYYKQNSHRLVKVHDSTNSSQGFKDNSGSTIGQPSSTADWDYDYDVKGNLTKDKNKRITSIKYNHLNLPVEIVINNNPTNSKIQYIYNASGEKLQKLVTSFPAGSASPSTATIDYCNGFQYQNSVLQFFPTQEGYVKNTVVNSVNNYTYVFNFTDHLGNVRLSYANDPSTNVIKILEENHYYPYGLKHTNYNTTLNAIQGKSSGSGIEIMAMAAAVPGGGGTIPAYLYNYKFNGMELQDDHDINLYDMDLRDYDPSIGRWLGIDPVTHHSQSTYIAMDGNPVITADPSGADGVVFGYAGQSAWSNPFPRGHQSFGNTIHGEQQSFGGNAYGGTNVGGGGIFWGSPAMMFQQSFEGHLVASMFSTSNPNSINAIYNYFAQSNGFSVPQTIASAGQISAGYIVNTSEQYSETYDAISKTILMGVSEMSMGGGLIDAIATRDIIRQYQNGGDVLEALTNYHGLNNLKAANKLFQGIGAAGWALEGIQLGAKIYNDKDKTSDYLRFGISTALTFVAISNPVGILAVGAYAAFDYYYGDQFWKATKIDY